uniref:NADH-ubiquinone oxidoreductase chain 4L n=1 Tax=Hydra oligactis TaxID=6088 RepID=A9YMC2_HYDOL|nr:NADH dehydrogenase subunit 4L [Hydra oligactis]ABW76616.1 NADH dehydrogenase subunit 4L [Hydra oligactis]
MLFDFNLLVLIMFCISIIGIIINRSNIILILISIEILLLSVSMNFMLSSLINFSLEGQIIAIYIITIATIESAIGLSIIVAFYKIKGSISLKLLNLLKG